MRALLLVALGLVGVAAIACGDDDEADTGGSDETSPAATREDEGTSAATDGSTARASGLEDEVQVEAADFSFSPDTFALPAGLPVKIEVTNSGSAPHTPTVYSDADYSTPVSGADTDVIDSGEDASIETTFDAGEYYFRCEIHPAQMEGDFTAE